MKRQRRWHMPHPLLAKAAACAVIIGTVPLFVSAHGTSALSTHGGEVLPFYHERDTGIRDKDEFIWKIRQEAFRVPAEDLMERVNDSLGITLEDKEAFIRFVESGDVTVLRCDRIKGDIELEGVLSDALPLSGERFVRLKRPCYEGEHLLAYRGRPFVSLACGNPIFQQREPSAAVMTQRVRPSYRTTETAPESVIRACENARVTRTTLFAPRFAATGVWTSDAGIAIGLSANGPAATVHFYGSCR